MKRANADSSPPARSGPRRSGRLSSLSTQAATRAAHIGLWALMGLTFFAAAVALLRPSAQASAAAKAPGATLGAQGFAELYLAAFLEAGKGTEASMLAFYPRAVDLSAVAPASAYAGRTTTIEAREVSKNYWGVTVAVEILYPAEGGLRSGGVRFFQVGVARPGGAYVATSLPAEIPAPPAGRRPRLVLGDLDRPDGADPLVAAVGQFATAYLTGNAELARYTAPGSRLAPVRPAPFTSVDVTALAAAQVPRLLGGAKTVAKEVLAEVQGTDANGRVQVLHYALALVQRDGRWEVAEVLPGPTLAPAQPPPSPPTTQLPDSPATAPSSGPSPAATAGPTPPSTEERTQPIP